MTKHASVRIYQDTLPVLRAQARAARRSMPMHIDWLVQAEEIRQRALANGINIVDVMSLPGPEKAQQVPVVLVQRVPAVAD